MAVKTLVVPLVGREAERSTLETAFRVARPFEAHVVGLHPQPSAGESTAGMMMSRASLGMSHKRIQETLAEADRHEQEETQRARRVFDEALAEHQGTHAEAPPGPGGLTGAFQVIEDHGDEATAARGRVFDLVVATQPKDDPRHRLRSLLRAFVFGSGRPVLMAPQSPPRSVGERVVIAWDGSALSARAAAISRQQFLRASRVAVLTAGGGKKGGPSARELADYLAWHGIEAELRETDPGARTLGHALLESAGAFGADLLVMGAYAQTPFRESLTGGLTNYILTHARMPVLLAH